MPKLLIDNYQDQVKDLFKELCPDMNSSMLDSFITDWTEVKNLSRKEVLVNKGAKDFHVYFVLDGSLRIYLPGKQSDHVFGFGYPRTFLVEIYSYFKNEPSKFIVETIKSTTLIGIHKSKFEHWIEEIPSLKKFWEQANQEAMFGLIEREMDLVTESPKERLDRLRKRSPHIFQLIPSKHIAAYLRMTPETLSRLNKS